LDAKALCAIAQASRSGYYKWLTHSDKPEKDRKDYLLVEEIFNKGKRKYGFRTIQMKLLKRKIIMNHKKIIRIMKKYHLFTRIRRRNPYKAIMKKSLGHRIFENKLNREFRQGIPFRVFCTDITYVPLNHRFAYLSVIKDIASGEVVAWNLSMHLEMDLVTETIENRRYPRASPWH
jgi:transposase InsO family protein